MRARAQAVVLTLTALGTVVAGPPATHTATSPDALVAAVAGWLAWAIAALVVTAIVLAAAARGRGRAAAISRRLLATYPTPVRRWAAAVAAVAVTAAGASPAAAAGPAATGRGHHAALPAAGPLDWPTVPRHARPAVATHPTVTVRPGECLWSIARRSLGRAATPAAVAVAWPRWWAANRDVIGPDPGLLHPGERLRAPARTDGRTSR